MSDTLVTVRGWIGTELDERFPKGHPVVSFRLALTPRKFSKEANGFVDMETNWYTINAWRTLGANALASLNKAEPVIVHGKQTTQTYTDAAGKVVQSIVIEAVSIGQDLAWGTSVFTRTSRDSGAIDADEVKAMNAGLAGEDLQIASDGRSIEDLVDTSTGEILEEHVA